MAVPKLRFKEFDGDWESKKLGTFAKTFSGGTPTSSNKDYYNGDIPFIKSGEISCTCTEQFINQKGLDSSSAKMVNQGDLLYALYGATSGQVAISQIHGAINQAVLCIRSEQNTVFLYNFFLLAKDDILSTYLQGGQGNLSAQILKNIEIPIPQLAEQTKIANFLSAVDTKIATLSQKVELLSQYKQGMMQKLFSQQIRFKADDGSEFGEWVSEKISKVFTNKSKSFNPLLNESLPCIELEHLSQNTGQILGIVNSSDQQSTKNLFEPNSVLYGKLRPYLRKFAKPQFKGVCSSEIWVLTGLKISNDYLFQFVQSEQFTELTNIQSGSKMPRADWNVIADAEIKFPCIEEQTKIANFLSAIDQKIEVTAQQIEQAKTWKKGLLQQMFV
ncbi:MAG: restriction endonuclease subunit S [Acinetobacter sp.]|uniref:restriction endonuclease subunit S n=1 Tax=uncultured Acinetobacter sp. TaxID=165433 RepID=UPI001B430D07|nr:restriction endonuclease subunit S [uncultured Acinetobacter sp.]MBP9787947.1 restriction endonuclease subunit S [Acinetobacter sp.]